MSHRKGARQHKFYVVEREIERTLIKCPDPPARERGGAVEEHHPAVSSSP